MILSTDPSIADLAADERALLAGLWRKRAESEASVGSVFGQLVAELGIVGAPGELIALAERAIRDEARHAAVCAELASAYHGEPIAVPPATPTRLPDYGEAEMRRRAALHALNLCCIGETIASAFVEACVAECEGSALREIHARHLADEIHHARVGWAYLAWLSEAERARLASDVGRLLEAQLRAWSSRIGELPVEGVRGHGYPPRAVLLATVHDAIRDLVFPGLDYLGIDSTAARAWFTSATG